MPGRELQRAWNVAVKDAISELADVPGGDTTGRYCIATPTFSEFSLAIESEVASELVPLPAVALGVLGAVISGIGLRRRMS